MRGFSAGLGAVFALFIGAGAAGAVTHEVRYDGGAHRPPQWTPAALVEAVPGAWPEWEAGGVHVARAAEEQFYCLEEVPVAGPAAPGMEPGPARAWPAGIWAAWDDEC